jgi:uncharacterized peroxidase-related enzyme
MWINYIPFGEATGKLKRLYDRVTGPDGNVDNIMLAHSLRPHTMEGHMALYKNVLHHNANKVPKSFSETLGVFVSLLNGCPYCVEHHFSGLMRLLKDDNKSAAIRTALEAEDFAPTFDAKEISALRYARSLTKDPGTLLPDHMDAMASSGWSHGEILEINQVVAYFNYANRTVLGLGVSTDGDVLGLSPNDSDDENNWGHS